MRGMLELRRETPLMIGVVHLPPLPGAPRYGGRLEEVLEAARRDAAALAEGGCDALILENFGDAPFHAERVPPETVAALALALEAVRAALGAGSALPLGVNVLRNDARAGLGLCAATAASFLRVNVHTGVAATDQGLLEGRAAETLRERARLCPDALVLADVHVKHARPLDSLSLADAAEDCLRRGLADALIVTGASSGSAPRVAELHEVRERLPEAPLLVGSGLTADNASELLGPADGAIVGTWLKRGGDVRAPVDPERVRRVRAALDALGASGT